MRPSPGADSGDMFRKHLSSQVRAPFLSLKSDFRSLIEHQDPDSDRFFTLRQLLKWNSGVSRDT